MQKISSAAEYSREMQMEIDEIRKFTPIFDYNDYSARESLVAALDEEMEFLRNFDPSEIIMKPEQDEEVREADLSITEVLNHPNPMSSRATFCYSLTCDADEVTITIYTIRGRRVRTIVGASARAGYNEQMWASEGDNGRKLASGTYLYKMVAERDGKRVQKVSKLSVIR
jgi:hypothetical protein